MLCNFNKTAVALALIKSRNLSKKYDLRPHVDSTCLINAIWHRNEPLALTIIAEFGDDCHPEYLSLNCEVGTALHFAAKRGLMTVVLTLLKRFGKKSLPDALPTKVISPLMWAVFHREPEVIDELIATFGIEYFIVPRMPFFGNNSELTLAAKNNDASAIRIFADAYSPERILHKNALGKTALDYLREHGSIASDSIKLLEARLPDMIGESAEPEFVEMTSFQFSLS